MKIFGKKRKGISYIPGNGSNSVYMSSKGIRDIVARFEESGKDKCLSIGSGISDVDKYVCLDYKKSLRTDIYGDIRCCFAPGFKERISEDSNLYKLQSGSYKLVKLANIVEHISWIHQELLFEWVNSLIVEGGLVFVSTPNIDYAVKMYLMAMQAVSKGVHNDQDVKKKLPNFPFDEHDYTKQARLPDIVKWANSRLYSGCSYDWDDGKFIGDFHHCGYNKIWLVDILSRYFKDVHICDEQSLNAVAQKPFTEEQGVDNLIKRSFQ